jgi:ferredoxin
MHGTVKIDAALCKGCALCIPACPKGLLRIDTARYNARGVHPVCLDDPGEALDHARLERLPLGFDAIGSGDSEPGSLQHDRPVRKKTVRREQRETTYRVDTEAARNPLVDDRTIDVAIRENPATLCKCGSDHLVGDLGAGSGEEQGLGSITYFELFVIEHQRPNPLSECGSAWLTAEQRVDPMETQSVGEQTDLCGLADPVGPFETDEHRRRLPT